MQMRSPKRKNPLNPVFCPAVQHAAAVVFMFSGQSLNDGLGIHHVMIHFFYFLFIFWNCAMRLHLIHDITSDNLSVLLELFFSTH